jgi:diadenosine tetraphosphate (Ap4A) HIT family hydrolase
MFYVCGRYNEISEVDVPWKDPVNEDEHVLTFKDGYPVTEGHLLFVPKYNSVPVLMHALKDAVEHGLGKVEDKEWDGFNIGINIGESAGQTVMWPHVHLIPRQKGDTEDPVGGVRNVIPGKGNYRKW